MKTMAVGFALAVAGLGMTFAGRADSEKRIGGHDYAPGCLVAVAVAPGFLPRADLIVENRLVRPIRVRLEGRAGSGLAAADLGAIGPQQQRIFTHALPAGRNVVIAEGEGSGGALRRVLFVNNHGAGTCSRRSMVRIE
jgi:hypothetical protein